MLNQPIPTLPKRPSQVSEQFNELERVMLDNENAIKELESRLGQVLGPLLPMPPADAPKCQAVQQIVPLAEGLRTLCQSAQRSRSFLRDIIDRLEV